MPRKVARDFAYLEERSTPEPNTGCWLWLLSLTDDGYAAMAGPWYAAHRLSAHLKHGARPDDLEVHHRCRQRSCVNPDHLAYVTHHENMLDSDVGNNRYQLKKTHCPYGHPLSGSNLRIKKTKTRLGYSRQCRACNNSNPKRHHD